MSNWAGGYVSDTGYFEAYYHQQSPAHIAVACLLRGIDCAIPRPDEPTHYLELGCGFGFGALALAASNPGWQVTAIDFNPTHVAAGRAIAAEAGLKNFTFLEADLASLAEDLPATHIPPADFVSLHGVWSWVTSTVRAGIIRLLKAKVRPGGVVHLSYNALPGWQGGLGLLHLVREIGRRSPGNSARQAQAGVEVARALLGAEARQLNNPFASGMLDRLKSTSAEYLAHEYMNAGSFPCFHADVTRDLAEAKLDWVAAGQLLENFPDLTLTAAQRAVADRFEDPLLWELVKDVSIGRAFRHDVFVRGPQRLDVAGRNRRVSDVRVALLNRPQDFQFEVEIPAGKATIARGFYARVVEALSGGPQTIATLDRLRDPGDAPNPAEVLGLLLGTEQAVVVTDGEATQAEGARRFNSVAAKRYVALESLARPVAAACTRLGAPLPCNAISLYTIDQLASGTSDPEVMAAELGVALPGGERDRLKTGIKDLLDTRQTGWRQLALA